MLRPALLSLALTFATLPAFAQARPADCPQLDEQLAELLAGAKQRVGREADMRVEFDVDERGRARLVSVDGARNYRSAVRLAMDGVECRGGQPQRYVLTIRFEDPSTALARAPQGPASQALAQAPR
jgi:hypothetical protein